MKKSFFILDMLFATTFFTGCNYVDEVKDMSTRDILSQFSNYVDGEYIPACLAYDIINKGQYDYEPDFPCNIYVDDIFWWINDYSIGKISYKYAVEILTQNTLNINTHNSKLNKAYDRFIKNIKNHPNDENKLRKDAIEFIEELGPVCVQIIQYIHRYPYLLFEVNKKKLPVSLNDFSNTYFLPVFNEIHHREDIIQIASIALRYLKYINPKYKTFLNYDSLDNLLSVDVVLVREYYEYYSSGGRILDTE